MLQKTPDELCGADCQRAPLLTLAVLVFEGDATVLVAEDALIPQGCAINVGR